jgi:hypothetical protein
LVNAGLDFEEELRNKDREEHLKAQLLPSYLRGVGGAMSTLREKIGKLFKRKEKQAKEVEEKYSSSWNGGSSFAEDSEAIVIAEDDLWEKSLKSLEEPKLKELFSKFNMPELLDRGVFESLYKAGKDRIYSMLEEGDGELAAYDHLILDDLYTLDSSNARRRGIDAWVMGQLMACRELGVPGIRIAFTSDSSNDWYRFEVETLLHKGITRIGNSLYDKLQIPLIYPEVSSYQEKIDPNDFSTWRVDFTNEKGVRFENCPREYKHLFMNEDYDMDVKFVDNLGTEMEWIQSRVDYYKKKLKIKEAGLVMPFVQKEVSLKRGFVVGERYYIPIFIFKSNGDPRELVRESIRKSKD